MSNTIKIKRSGVSSQVPSSLEYGELALNYADGKMFYKNSSGDVVEFPATQSLNIDGGNALVDIFEAEVTNFVSLIYDGGEL